MLNRGGHLDKVHYVPNRGYRARYVVKPIDHSRLTACLTAGKRDAGSTVLFKTGINHSSFHARCTPETGFGLSTFGRALISIQVMFSFADSTRRSNASVSTSTVPEAGLTDLAVAIAGSTSLLPQKLPEQLSTWTNGERSGMLLGSDLEDDGLISQVRAVVAQACGNDSVGAIQKIHLLLSGSFKGQVTSKNSCARTNVLCRHTRSASTLTQPEREQRRIPL